MSGVTGDALPGAERARFARRWLQSGRGARPWEAALVLLVQHQVLRADVELWTLALQLPVQVRATYKWYEGWHHGQECLRAAAEEPRNDWPVEAGRGAHEVHLLCLFHPRFRTRRLENVALTS